MLWVCTFTVVLAPVRPIQQYESNVVYDHHPPETGASFFLPQKQILKTARAYIC